MSGGVVGPGEAPVLLATVVVILATLAQVAYLLARGQKIDTMLWVSLVLVVVLGGADDLVPQRDLHQVEADAAVLGDGPRAVGWASCSSARTCCGCCWASSSSCRSRSGSG